MAIESGYYNSLNGDRKYNAETMSKYFNGLFTRGVLQNYQGKFVVEENEGMTVIVSSGKAYFSDGKWIENTTDLLVNIEAADVVLNRIDRIVLRNDRTKEGRKATVEVKKGTPSGSPTAPELTNNEDIEELSLATISVTAKQSEIKQINITNTIPDTDVCGYVTGIIEQVDTSDLYKQYQDAYKEFYDDNDERFNDLYTGNESRFDDMYTENGKKLDDQLEENDDTFNEWFSGIKNDIAEQLPLKQYLNTVTTTTDEQKVIPIGIAEYQPETDILEVFINGMRLNASEYTSDGSNVTLTNGLDSGQPVEMVVNKYIVNGDDPATLAGQVNELQSEVKDLEDNKKINATDASYIASPMVYGDWGNWSSSLSTGGYLVLGTFQFSKSQPYMLTISIGNDRLSQAEYRILVHFQEHSTQGLIIDSRINVSCLTSRMENANYNYSLDYTQIPIHFCKDSNGNGRIAFGDGTQIWHNTQVRILDISLFGTVDDDSWKTDFRNDWGFTCVADLDDLTVLKTLQPDDIHFIDVDLRKEVAISDETIEAFKKLGFVPSSEGGGSN